MNEILMEVLIGVGILFLLVLIIMAIKIIKTFGNINKVVEDNRINLEKTLYETSRTLRQTNDLIETINKKDDELKQTLVNVQNITSDISAVTGMISGTAKKGEQIINQTTEAFRGFNQITKSFRKDNDE